jgi:hypothetical protein
LSSENKDSKRQRHTGLHFKDVDIKALDDFTYKIKSDRNTFRSFKDDPLGELKKLGVFIEPESVIGKRILRCAGQQSGDTIQERQGCVIFPSGDHCLIITIPPDEPPIEE